MRGTGFRRNEQMSQSVDLNSYKDESASIADDPQFRNFQAWNMKTVDGSGNSKNAHAITVSDPSADVHSLNEGSGSAVDMSSLNKNGGRSKEVSALDAVDVINPEAVCIKPATVRN